MPLDSIEYQAVSWQENKEDLTQIRRHVFIEEQNVPEELEWDEYDESSTHFLATDKDKVIAVARLKADGQIGRIAVLAEYRNQGIGSNLLRYILQVTASKNLGQVYLHAQTRAVPFYERQGFKAHGDVFFEANIPHRGMSKNIC